MANQAWPAGIVEGLLSINKWSSACEYAAGAEALAELKTPLEKENEMERPVLTDKTQFPTEETVFTHIGKYRSLWISFFDYLNAEHPDFSKEWRYYNDGKSWLLKESRKAKTVFWLSLAANSFRITFYFNDKAEQAINGSGISDELKEQFKNGKRYNKIRGLTIGFKNKKDVEYAKELTEIKILMK